MPADDRVGIGRQACPVRGWPFGRRYWCRSEPHMPDAFISTTTSPGPGVGSGNVISSRPRSPVNTTPCMVSSAALRCRQSRMFRAGWKRSGETLRRHAQAGVPQPATSDAMLPCSVPGPYPRRLSKGDERGPHSDPAGSRSGNPGRCATVSTGGGTGARPSDQHLSRHGQQTGGRTRLFPARQHGLSRRDNADPKQANSPT